MKIYFLKKEYCDIAALLFCVPDPTATSVSLYPVLFSQEPFSSIMCNDFIFYLHLFVLGGEHTHAMFHLWRLEGSLHASLLSLPHVAFQMEGGLTVLPAIAPAGWAASSGIP